MRGVRWVSVSRRRCDGGDGGGGGAPGGKRADAELKTSSPRRDVGNKQEKEKDVLTAQNALFRVDCFNVTLCCF